jgi:hypothetical protein
MNTSVERQTDPRVDRGPDPVGAVDDHTGLKASMSHAPLTSGDAPAPHWLWKK